MLRSLSIAVALGVFSTASACPASDAIGTARWIQATHYAFYVSGNGSREFLSAPLFQLLKDDWKCQNANEICAIGANPWTEAQDGEILGQPSFRTVSSGRTTAKVEMTYLFGWREMADKAVSQRSYLYLAKDPATYCWVLDDLVGPQGQSLRQALTTFRHEP
jgi:hypothetical protein